MHVLIVYCHPSKKSYTYDVLEQIKKHLEEEGIGYELSYLYAMDFRSDMSEAEYEREGAGHLTLPLPEDVQKEHKKIERADGILFLYPVWWSDCPAKLKGWFDRVYSVGYAYGTQESHPEKVMKKVDVGFVVCTAGHPVPFLEEIGIAESMRNVMIDDRLGKRFKYKEMMVLGGTLDKEKVRGMHSEMIQSIGKKMKRYSGNHLT